MVDAAAARHVVVGEGDRVEAELGAEPLVPLAAPDRGLLQRIGTRLAAAHEIIEQGRYVARAALAGVEKGDRILHRQPRARADRRVPGAQRIADEHDVAPVPAPVANDGVAEPRRAVGEQRLAAETAGEGALAAGQALGLAHAAEAGALEGGRVGLDEEGAARGAVLVGVGDQQAGLDRLEDERKRLEEARRAVPGEQVRPLVEHRPEVLGVACADGTVGAIGGHHEIAAGELGFVVDAMAETEHYARFATGAVQRLQ